MNSIPNVLVVGNNKGGARKSTLTSNLAGEMWGAGWRVLVVDLDDQGDMGKHLFWRESDIDDGGKALHDAMVHGGVSPVVKSIGGREGFDAIIGGPWAILVSGMLTRRESIEQNLGDVLRSVAHDYDCILIDTQPSISEPFHLEALANARFVISPVNQDQEDSTERYSEHVRRIQRDHNPELVPLGLVLFEFTRGPGAPKEHQYEAFEKASGGTFKAYRQPIFQAKGAVKYCRLAQMFVHEYAVHVEKSLREVGSSYGLSSKGLNVTVAGKKVTKKQRDELPDDAYVVGDVLLGGGLAGDYFNLGRMIMADITQNAAGTIDLTDDAMTTTVEVAH